MAIIRHYTKPHWVQSILTTGYIQPERCNSDYDLQHKTALEFYGDLLGKDIIMQRPSALQQQNEDIIEQAKGNQVWFTEQRNAASAIAGNAFKECYFEFDSEAIGAVKWHYFKRRFTNQHSKNIISALDRSAKHCGDDPYLWWVTETAVPVMLARPTGVMALGNSTQDIVMALRDMLKQKFTA